MKASTAAVLLAAFKAAQASKTETNPVAKVLDMLAGLESKILGEGEEAQKAYDEFAEWCEDGSKNLQFEIKTGKSESESLKATILEETSTIEALSAKIEELAEGIATDEADLKAATEIRTQEAADFAAEEKELSEVIDTLSRAVGILEREMAKGGASMIQNAGSVVQAIDTLVAAPR
jgi:predicted RNase H-like nuclease (RuvC/YqgF family)